MRQAMKKEATKRMEELHISPIMILEWEEKERVFIASDYPEDIVSADIPVIEAQIQKIEEQGDLVYYGIFSITDFGVLLNLCYVSEADELWEEANRDIKNNCLFVYVANLTYPELSEYGTISVIQEAGQLKRTV
ncbi:hypothetical protein [Listeria grayi]|uniref:hypothetical protein n=1 Tax=Listeria grayi TaxID=1641 RepID=UPI001623A150|nr:hypothetical protein [Listeria grayi]MBC1922976.1 hypothetical protein [Listeria grayi]